MSNRIVEEVVIEEEDYISVGGAVDWLTDWLRQGQQPVLNRETLAALHWHVNEVVSFTREIIDNSNTEPIIEEGM